MVYVNVLIKHSSQDYDAKLMKNNKNVCWPKLLINVTEEYKNTPHLITQFSPKFLMFAIKPYEEYNFGSSFSLEEIRNLVFHNNLKGHENNKYYYDKAHQPYCFKEGDLIYVINKNDHIP